MEKFAPKATLPQLSFDLKDEKLQLKTSITFFALKAMGQLCRFHMLQSYRRDGASYDLNENERVVFEGIYVTSSLATSEVILKLVEEYVYPTSDADWDSEPRLEEMWLDNFIHLQLENVAWVEFIPNDDTHLRQCINITRTGFVKV